MKTTSEEIVDRAATQRAALQVIKSSKLKIKRAKLVALGTDIADAIRILKECQQLIIELPEDSVTK